MLQHPTQPYMKQILQPLLQDAVLILRQGGREQCLPCGGRIRLDEVFYSSTSFNQFIIEIASDYNLLKYKTHSNP